MIIFSDAIRLINQKRCDRWHNNKEDWTLGDWGNALAGEVGELCNVVKKLRRHESKVSLEYNTPELNVLIDNFAEEVADVLLYLDLLCWKAGVKPYTLERILEQKFNEVSQAQGWPDLIIERG